MTGSRQRKLRAEQRAPGLQRVALATLAREIDGGCGLLLGRAEQVARTLLARLVHAVADRRPQPRRVGPGVEDPVGERGKEALDLAIETPAETAVQGLQRHDLDQEGRLDRLLAV